MKFIDRCGLDSFQDFDNFIQKYGNMICAQYQLLNGIVIDVTDINTAIMILCNPIIDVDYFQDTPYCCNTEKLFIVDNLNMFISIGFTEDERQALIAHEIGHIYLKLSKTNQGGLNEELAADQFACLLGLKSELKSALIKLENFVHNQVLKNEISVRINNLP